VILGSVIQKLTEDSYIVKADVSKMEIAQKRRKKKLTKVLKLRKSGREGLANT
jgi:hypothetical protein